MSFVTLGIEYFADPNQGRPVANGYIYIGEVDTDPTVPANQVEVVARQENGTEVVMSQPIRTNSGGVPTYNGSPVQLLVSGFYSITVQDHLASQVYYMPDSDPVASGGPAQVFSVPTLADLQALAGGSSPTVYMESRTTLGDGGGGPVYWDSSDLSTEVVADEVNAGEGDGGRFTAPAADKTGASGAWVRFIKDAIYVNWYGTGEDAANAALSNAPDGAIVKYVEGTTDTWANTVTITKDLDHITLDFNGAIITYTGTDDALVLTYDPADANNFNGGHVVKNGLLVGPNPQFGGARNSVGAGINNKYRNYCQFLNMDISGFKYGIFQNSITSTIGQGTYTHNNDYGVYYYSTIQACNANIMTNSRSRENFIAGVWFTDNLDADGNDNFTFEIVGNKIDNCLIESNNSYPYAPASHSAPPAGSVGVYLGKRTSRSSITHCYIENHAASVYMFSGAFGRNTIDTMSMTGGVIMVEIESGQSVVTSHWSDIHNLVAKPSVLFKNTNFYAGERLKLENSFGVDSVGYTSGASTLSTTGANSTDTFTLVSHGLDDNDLVYCTSADTGGVSPGGIYWVTNSAADTFTLSNTEGGSTIGLTQDGNAAFIALSRYYSPLRLANLTQNSAFYGIIKLPLESSFLSSSSEADAALVREYNGLGTTDATVDVSGYENLFFSVPGGIAIADQVTEITDIVNNRENATGKELTLYNSQSTVTGVFGLMAAAVAGIPSAAPTFWFVNNGDTVHLKRLPTSGGAANYKLIGHSAPATTTLTHANYRGQPAGNGDYIARQAFRDASVLGISWSATNSTTEIELADASDNMKTSDIHVFSIVTNENGLAKQRIASNVTGTTTKTVTFSPALTGTEVISGGAEIRLTSWTAR